MPLIVFEGIDGSGKSTQVRLLAEAIRAAGFECVTSFEPTNGKYGKRLRESAATGRMNPGKELAFFHCDRRAHVKDLIAPALAAGKFVVLDRYYFSTMAYQSLRGFDPQEIREHNEKFAPVPDRLFIMDVDVDTALARIGARGDVANEFEKREALAHCRTIFLSLADEPFAAVIDASRSPEAVASQVRWRYVL